MDAELEQHLAAVASNEGQVAQEIVNENTHVDAGVTLPNADDDTLPSETKPDASMDKFRGEDGEIDVAKLEASYRELEKKLAGGGDEVSSEDGVDDDTSAGEDLKGQEEKVDSILTEAGFEREALEDHFDEHGDLSDEHYAKFEEMGYPAEMVNMYVRGLAASGKEVAALTEKANETVGGQENYNKMVEWAAENLTAAEIQSYNDDVNSFNAARTQKAVEVLYQKYKTHGPAEPETTLGGDGNAIGSDVYASEAEWYDDVADPRYDTNEGYRNKVIAKRMRSNWN